MVKSYGATAVFDYTSTDTVAAIRKLTRGKLRYALDCITDEDSVRCCYGAIGRTGGRYACLELCPEHLLTRKAVQAEFVMALDVFGQKVELDRGYQREASAEKHEAAVKLFAMFQRLVNGGKLRPHPTQLVEGGLSGVLEGLKILKSGGVSGRKLIAVIDRKQ